MTEAEPTYEDWERDLLDSEHAAGVWHKNCPGGCPVAKSGEGMALVDVREMALVATVDRHGMSRVLTGLGYTKRQQADILRTLASAADRQADEDGEPKETDR